MQGSQDLNEDDLSKFDTKNGNSANIAYKSDVYNVANGPN